MIRLADASDAPSLAEVHIASWQRAYRGIFPDDFLDDLDPVARERRFRQIMAGGNEILLAEPDDRVVGFASLGPAAEPGWGEVRAIYVHPDHWGAGHGRELLAAVELRMEASGWRDALLWVIEGNAGARAFYERCGWSIGPGLKLEEIAGTQISQVRYQKHLGGGPGPSEGPRGMSA